MSHTVLTQQMQNIRDISDNTKNYVEQVETYHLQCKQYSLLEITRCLKPLLNLSEYCTHSICAYNKTNKIKNEEVFIFRS